MLNGTRCARYALFSSFHQKLISPFPIANTNIINTMAIKYGIVGAQCKTAEKKKLNIESKKHDQITRVRSASHTEQITAQMHTMKCVNIYYLSGNFRYMLFTNNNNSRTKFGMRRNGHEIDRYRKGSVHKCVCVYRIELFKQHLFRLGCFFESICTHEIRSKIKEMGRKGKRSRRRRLRWNTLNKQQQRIK